MSYTPTTWDTGDIVTAEKMNKIETGLQTVTSAEDNTAKLEVTVTKELDYVSGLGAGNRYTTNKTAEAIRTAFNAGAPVIFRLITEVSAGRSKTETGLCTRASLEATQTLTPNPEYEFDVRLDGNDLTFEATAGASNPSVFVPNVS